VCNLHLSFGTEKAARRARNKKDMSLLDKKIPKQIIIVSIAYFSLYAIAILLREYTGISLTSNRIRNVLHLGFFFVPLLPILWFWMIKINWLKILLSVVYVFFLIPFYLVSSLAILFTLNDVLSDNGNGFREVYKKEIEKGKYIKVFRTPDQGALGGDFTQVAIVRELLPGLENRTWLPDNQRKYQFNNDSDFVYIRNKKYNIPKEKDLRMNGNLKR